jgi:ABC-type transport system substrate-binding protein
VRETNGLLRQETHLAVIDQWKQGLGDVLKPKYTALEALAYSRAGRTREYEDVYFAWSAGPAFEPDGFIFGLLHSKSSNNYTGVKDPEIDRWAEAQRVEMDQAKRQPLWQQVMDRDLDQVYRAFTYIGYKTMARRGNLFNVLDAMHAWAPGFRGGAQWGWKSS